MLITGGDKCSVWIWKYISWGPKERDDIQSTTITNWSIQRQEASFNGSETREVGQQHMVNFFIVLVVHLVVYFCTANPSPMILYLTEPFVNEVHRSSKKFLIMDVLEGLKWGVYRLQLLPSYCDSQPRAAWRSYH